MEQTEEMHVLELAEAFYRQEEVIPWDIPFPQPEVVALEEAGEIVGRVLDVGCGLGENALFLAERGYEVVGIDASISAVERCQSKARARGLRVDFQVGDVTNLDGIVGHFGAVIDSGLLHCLPRALRRQYLAALHRVCERGARMHLLCFSDAMPEDLPIPDSLSESDVRDLFNDGWEISRLRRTTYTSAFNLDALRRHLSDQNWQPSSQFVFDHAGRILDPIWQATAVRA